MERIRPRVRRSVNARGLFKKPTHAMRGDRRCAGVEIMDSAFSLSCVSKVCPGSRRPMFSPPYALTALFLDSIK
jgi:hypothetical protein